VAAWSTFFLVSIVSVIALYLVGFLLLKAAKLPTLFALAAAPIISTFCFEVLAIAYDKIDLFASGWNLFLPVFVFALIVFIASTLARKRQKASSSLSHEGLLPRFETFDVKMIVLYAGLGLGVGLFIFVRALDGTECFNETYDNLTHLGLIRSFVESGHYSTLAASLYRDLGTVGSYYPAAWHMIAAMVADVTNTSNLLVTNAMNYVCCALVYPLSCLCLLRAIFADRKSVVVAGAFACIAFVGFPWFFTVYGVLESNLFGFIMVPVMLCALMQLCAPGVRRITRVSYLIICVISVAFCVFAQPNTFFAVMLFAIPYLAWRIWDATGPQSVHPRSSRVRIGLVALFFVAMFIVWYACYKAPFLYDVTHFIWAPVASKSQALINTLLFSNSWSPAAFVVAILVIIGLFTMLKERRYGWIALALGMTAVVYWAGVCLEGRWDQFLTGFWYSDWRRTAALQAMIAVPVAAIGIARLYELLPNYFKSNAFLKLCLSLVLLLAIFFPSFTVRGMGFVKTPFGYFADMMDEYYSMDQTDDEIIFSESEQRFAKQAKEIVGDDIVYNIPYDGSFLAYQVDGLRTVYRLPYTGAGHNADEKILQAKLADYASDAEAAEALENIGARYVLMLDQGHIPYHRTWPDYYPENWVGITNINEDTPGFELVLSEGDMRLYRIIDTN
jgi:hypothetical protein